ncbi:bZIP transcription factor [Ferrimonas kyonanensis]|uniref:bZIP transcription factor n=1 Tax=Ferrimonas kyonanensis TaxID=364763 RepID=UPI000404B71E|nr:bZIP transcription factor [Ferrimonas kyonanensis]
MKKKQLALSLVCASMVMLTGCNDDETVYETSPEMWDKLEQLETENEALEQQNEQLAEQNTALVAEVNYWKHNGSTVAPHDFTSQCAAIGIEFDYVDPNTPEAARVMAVSAVAGGDDCLSCHTYDGSGDTGVTPPHGDYGDCAGCHEGHDGGTDPGGPSGEPTDPTYTQPSFAAGAVDGKTGASGASYYGSGSYLNAQWLQAQLDAQVHNYRWSEAADGDTGVSTLAAACALDNRQHMTQMFPEDGKAYVIESKENAIGAKLVATVNKFDDNGTQVETPNIATFGFGLKEIEGEYYTSMFIGKNNTCYNAIMNGEARLSYYEYDPTQFAKTGLEEESRNRGARIIVSTDYTRTGLFAPDWATPVPGLGAGETFKPEDVDWNAVGACNLTFKVESIIPLG